jgi:hypothetical protein
MNSRSRSLLSIASRILAWTTAGVAICALLTFTSFHVINGNSDGATVILEGQSLAHGDLLLHSWILSQDSFWTSDALFYGLFILVLGLHGYLLHLIPALIATLIIFVGARIATADNGSSSTPVAYLIVGAGLLFPVAAWAQFYLAGPYHLATTLGALVSFYLCAVKPTMVRYTLAALVLCLATLGDLQAISLGVVPLVVAGLIAIVRRWQIRDGAGYVIVGIGGTLLALVVRKIAEVIGTFTFAAGRSFAGPSLALSNVVHGLGYGANLMGVGTGPFGKSSMPSALLDLHLVELIAIVLGIIVAFIQLVRGLVSEDNDPVLQRWRIDDLLLVGIFCSFGTFIFLAVTGSDAEARYLSAGLIFAIILVARLVSRWSQTKVTEAWRRVLLGLLIVITIAFGVGSYDISAQTLAPSPVATLVSFLHAHQLREGIGGYWSASITTVVSNGTINVRPVETGPSGMIIPFVRQTDTTWYHRTNPNFLVFYADVAVDGITRKIARKDLGPAAHTYNVGPYRVLVYRHPLPVSLGG